MLDNGRVFSTVLTRRDRRRSAANVGFLKAMGYDAVGLNVRDFVHGRNFLRETFADAGIPLLACNVVDERRKLFTEPFVVKEIDGKRVAIIGVFSKEDARLTRIPGRTVSLGPSYERALAGLEVLDPIETTKKAIKRLKGVSIIIVLSQLSAEDNVKLAEENPSIDLILSDASLDETIKKLQPPEPGETRDYLKIGTTYLLQPVSPRDAGGKEIAIVRSTMMGPGLTEFDLERKRVAQSLAEDPELKKQLEDFLNELKNDPLIRREAFRRFYGMHQESDPDNGYLGAADCAKCHQAQFAQWQTTEHADALQSLVDKQQDTIERCLGCHTTGFGYDTGFATAEETPGLANVQCETCHGPGKKHVASPRDAVLIRSRPQKAICMQCHNKQAVPPITDFDDVYEEYRERIVH